MHAFNKLDFLLRFYLGLQRQVCTYTEIKFLSKPDSCERVTMTIWACT